jgi:hypothetical protein
MACIDGVSRWLACGLVGVGQGVGGGEFEPTPPEPGAPGELENGTFHYRCLDEGDARCDEGEPDGVYIPRIAVRGRFGLSYQASAGSGSRSVTAPGTGKRLIGSGAFEARLRGAAVILAGRSTVEDLIHVYIEEVASLRVRGLDNQPITQMSLVQGEEVVLLPRPYSSGRLFLAGSLGYDWESGDPDVIVRTNPGGARRGEFEAVGPGETVLTVTTVGKSLTIPVSVTEHEPDTGGSGETDSGTDTESGSDTGSTSTSGATTTTGSTTSATTTESTTGTDTDTATTDTGSTS